MARSREFTHGVVLGILGQVITMVAGFWIVGFPCEVARFSRLN